MLAPAGEGARHVRAVTLGQRKGKLPVLCETVPTISLDAVPHYRHLGSVLTYNGSLGPEAKARVQLARQLFKEGKNTVFCTPRICLPRRVLLLRSHVLSAMLAGCGAWPELGAGAWRSLETCYFNMLRLMLRIPHSAAQNWSTEKVLASVGLPSLSGLVSADRIRFLSQALRHGPDELFVLMQNSMGALSALSSASRWVLQACSATTELGDLGDLEARQVLAYPAAESASVQGCPQTCCCMAHWLCGGGFPVSGFLSGGLAPDAAGRC